MKALLKETNRLAVAFFLSAQIEETLRWEEGKKWQRTIEKMKMKIKEKDEEIEKLNLTVERLKSTLERYVEKMEG